MSDVREALDTLLSERPEAREALAEIHDVDEDGAWEFEDIAVDSGLFGEIVSRGIVEKDDGAYRLVDRAAVAAALEGRSEPDSPEETDESSTVSDLLDIDWRAAGPFVASLLFVALMRVVFALGAVFRDGRIVLTGNDPYRRRFLVRSLLDGHPAFDPTALAALPDVVRTGEPLTLTVLWWISALFGGTEQAVGQVLAWYPVVAGVVVAGLVYGIAIRVSGDRRVALAAVCLLAVTPAHAYRTSLGFADHHAFDYVWLAATVYGLVVTAGTTRDIGLPDRTTAGLTMLVLGIFGQIYAWHGGPILLVPLGICLFVLPLGDLKAGRNPLQANRGLLGALAVAAVLTLAVHVAVEWGTLVRALIPTLIAFFGVVSVGLAWRLSKSGYGTRQVALVEVGVGTLIFGVVWAAIPQFQTVLGDLAAYFSRTNETNIAETLSLFSGQLGVVTGPILLLGFTLFLAFPYMVWGVWQARDDGEAGWTFLSVYAWFFFVLAAAIQIRFAAQLAVFASVFAALGFVHLAEWVDIAEPPRPFAYKKAVGSEDLSWRPTRQSKNIVLALVMLFLLVGGIGIIQTPIKTQQLAIDGESYEVGEWLAEASADQDGDTYVFSQWGQNRFYNFIVGGDYGSYGYAQEHYAEFLAATDATSWANRLRDQSSNTYVVMGPVSADFRDSSLQTRLHQQLGSASDSARGLSDFRLVYLDEGSEYRVFRPAKTATLVDQRETNGPVTLSTDVTVSNETITYERRPNAGPDGWYSVRVPYSGTYAGDESNRTVTSEQIHEQAILMPQAVIGRSDSGAVAHYDFDGKYHPNYTAETVGGYHGRINATSRIERRTDDGQALALMEPTSHVTVEDIPPLVTENDSFTVSMHLRGNLTRDGASFPTVLQFQGPNASFGVWARDEAGDFGARLDINDANTRNFGIGRERFSNWTRVKVVYSAEKNELQLYVDGKLVSVSETPGRSINGFERLYIGSDGSPRQAAPVLIDDLRVYDRAVLNRTAPPKD
ncbi:LamG-like jellyroll fold domain-containing protein [Halorientalis regularis]|uniref:dolichyl-phosphooligosaccharide-protein glycotransferase n=1 Tax=Halorientalis regularis TaxID=660518 RepID=A0A1G7T2Y3_9EURY|nr:LamG-like jellyroll fold domain-containing protein [Halorientalis regularis]SDG29394.1 dolichyl-diphosphooligosaccharide--protein glycosyltransferase [Halorientalis regularis]